MMGVFTPRKRANAFNQGGFLLKNMLLNIYQQPTGHVCPSETKKNGKLYCVGEGKGGGEKGKGKGEQKQSGEIAR